MPHDPAVLEAVVKAYDVRGVTATHLTPALVHDLGVAAAEVLAAADRPFLIGRDMRPSSPALVDAFASGLTGQGVDVIDLGLASTDLVSYASGVLDAPAAMFTASHNPAAYNGIKLCRAGAVPVAIDTGLADLRDRVLAGVPDARPDAERGARTQRDLLGDFAAHVRSFVDVEVLRPVRVAVDAGNGMAGHVWPAVVEGLPIETTPLYFELDGTFPNHPANPLEPDNLRDLQAAVRDGGHALGLAFDGDADRVFAVDETGRSVASSLVGAVVADRLLRHHPGETVLHNLICSRVVPETIEAAGGTAVRTRVGHSFIKRRMAETGAIYAVEHSGHFYFRDHYRADSGLVAALVLLEAVAEADAPLSEVIAPYDRYPSSGEINLEVDDPGAAVDAVAAAFVGRGVADREDGLTVVVGDGWFNLRPSNTEPLLRLNVEGDDTAALERLRDEVRSHLDATS
ncbi:phosphomannomutase/phosphoglucomutase [Nitriliruptor alkaliphilus]|uniref:phosphomannomutase/phosphoglucomutase n=1 Tax=Nitriliruptor alkaliphilus TaxID=427918 RepID=UPI000696AF06|nr:phosphomannomutase/phosphoglucomutase [Nitriliruptor alkaliphilus]